MRLAWLQLLVIVSTFYGCTTTDNVSDCTRGTERCACLLDQRCNGSLECVSGKCFRLATASGGTSTVQGARAAPKKSPAASNPSAGAEAAKPRAGSGGASAGTAPVDPRNPSQQNSGGSAAMRSKPSAQSQCSPQGGSCDTPCCGSAICSSDVCAGPCDSNVDCESRCCLDGAGVCTSTDTCFAGGVPAEVDTAAAACAAPGGNCSRDWCCAGPCISDTCATPCTSASDCESGCCRDFSSGAQCAPSTLCVGHVAAGGITSSANVAIARCPGALTLVADDGKFLGNATSDKYAADGVCNQYSNYGGEYGTDSIFNRYGTYGSEYAQQSAFNQYTSTPPFLLCAATNTKLNPVTKNMYQAGAIEPAVLCLVLEANGY